MPLQLPFLNQLKSRFDREKITLGIDVGTAFIKFAKVRFQKETVELSAFGMQPTPIDAVPLVKKMLVDAGLHRINTAVSGPSVLLRYIVMTRMQQAELHQAIKFEGQKHIPFSISDVNVDAHILRNDLPDNKMMVLMAAVKKDALSQRLKLMEDAGAKVLIVDTDSLAAINAFTFNYADEEGVRNKTVALLNLGAVTSNLNIIENGIPRLSRDIHVAGNHLTQRIADSLAVDFKQAEELKKNPAGESRAKIETASENVIAQLAREIRVSFDYYESQSASAVSKIYLSGGGSLFFNLKKSLFEQLGIEVEEWDCVRKIILAESVSADALKPVLPHLAVAVGLALRTY